MVFSAFIEASQREEFTLPLNLIVDGFTRVLAQPALLGAKPPRLEIGPCTPTVILMEPGRKVALVLLR
jgi:hypothetical protein